MTVNVECSDVEPELSGLHTYRDLNGWLRGCWKRLDSAAAPFHTTTALAAAIHNTEVRAPAAQGMYSAYLECGV